MGPTRLRGGNLVAVGFRHRAWMHEERRAGVDAAIARRAEGLAGQAGTSRVMFNNNRGDDAPVAAGRMRERLDRAPVAR